MILNPLLRSFYSIVSPGNTKGKLQIFIFHRVLDKPDPLMPGEPDVIQFERIVDMLSKVYNVISLPEAVERLKQKTLPSRAACITFDDGYKDNFSNAYPILKKYGLPATIFVATDYLGDGMMWNDIIIESIRGYNDYLTVNELDIHDVDCQTDNQKKDLIKLIIGKIKYKKYAERIKFVEQLEQSLGYQRKMFMMSNEDVKNISGDLITIGAHTKTHPILTTTTESEAKIEIGESKEYLEGLLNKKIDSFAYPNGQPGTDYGDKDVVIVKQLGFKAAVSTRKSIANYQDSPFELPRFTPWDKSMTKFMLRNIRETYKS